MNWGSIFQLFVLFVLALSTQAEYKGEEEYINQELHYLRVQKSYQQIATFEKEYGPNWKQVIRNKTEEFKQMKLTNWNHMVYKSLFLVMLFMFSVFFAIRYFYLNAELEQDDEVVKLKYNTVGWSINFLYLLLGAGWLYYFSNNTDGAIVLYGLGIVNLMLAIFDLSKMYQLKKAVKGYARAIMLIISAILYYHLIAMVFARYLTDILALIELLERST